MSRRRGPPLSLSDTRLSYALAHAQTDKQSRTRRVYRKRIRGAVNVFGRTYTDSEDLGLVFLVRFLTSRSIGTGSCTGKAFLTMDLLRYMVSSALYALGVTLAQMTACGSTRDGAMRHLLNIAAERHKSEPDQVPWASPVLLGLAVQKAASAVQATNLKASVARE